jgi:hypothetical protein
VDQGIVFPIGAAVLADPAKKAPIYVSSFGVIGELVAAYAFLYVALPQSILLAFGLEGVAEFMSSLYHHLAHQYLLDLWVDNHFDLVWFNAYKH